MRAISVSWQQLTLVVIILAAIPEIFITVRGTTDVSRVLTKDIPHEIYDIKSPSACNFADATD